MDHEYEVYCPFFGTSESSPDKIVSQTLGEAAELYVSEKDKHQSVARGSKPVDVYIRLKGRPWCRYWVGGGVDPVYWSRPVGDMGL